MASLFARSAELQRATSLVMAGASIEILGTRWSGRTEILRQLAAALVASDVSVIAVRGVPDAAPMEALKLALPHPRRANPNSWVGMIAALSEIIAEGPTVILIDDIDLLDPHSWTVLESLHKSTGVQLIGTRLAHGGFGPGDRMLLKMAHPVSKIELEDLKLGQLRELLEDHLSGPISPTATSQLHTKSAGILGLALALTDASVDSGLLRKQDAIWIEASPIWSPALEYPYETILYSFDPSLQEAAETLSLIGPVELETAITVLGHSVVEDLELHNLARLVSSDDRHIIAVSPPGIADYFRNRPASVRRLRLISSIESALGRNLQWGQSGDPASVTVTTQLPLVARMFTEAYRMDLSVAFHGWTQSHSVADANRILRRQLEGERNDTIITQVFAETARDGALPLDDLTFRYLQARWLMNQGAAFDDVTSALTPLDPDHSYAPALSAIRLAFRMERFELDDDFEAKLIPVAGAPGLNGQIGSVILANAYILSGNAHKALVFLNFEPDETLRGHVLVARGMAMLATGRIADAARWAARHLEHCVATLDRITIPGLSYISVIALAALGRYDEAAEAGNIVLSTAASAGVMLFPTDKPLLIALAALATRAERNSTVQSLLDRADRISIPSDALPMGGRAFVEASAAAADGDTARAGVLYRNLAQDLNSRGYVLAADNATMIGLMADFDETQAAAFRSRAHAIGGDLYTGHLDARAASRAQDPDRLAAAARVLESENAEDEALKYFTQAAKIYQDRGKTKKAIAIRGEIRRLMEASGPSSSWPLSTSSALWGLTAKEQQLASDVAAGLSNSDIAVKHSISIRTVETHLRNIRQKTGAIDRADIALYSPTP